MFYGKKSIPERKIDEEYYHRGLTAGEPANASEMLALNIYNTFYGRSGAQWKGIGQAKAVVFFLIVVVISLVQLHFTRSKEVQQ